MKDKLSNQFIKKFILRRKHEKSLKPHGVKAMLIPKHQLSVLTKLIMTMAGRNGRLKKLMLLQ